MALRSNTMIVDRARPANQTPQCRHLDVNASRLGREHTSEEHLQNTFQRKHVKPNFEDIVSNTAQYIVSRGSS